MKKNYVRLLLILAIAGGLVVVSCVTYPKLEFDELRWKTYKGGIHDDFTVQIFEADADTVYQEVLQSIIDLSLDREVQILRFQEDTDKLKRIESEIVYGEGQPYTSIVKFDADQNGGYVANYKKFAIGKPILLVVYVFPRNKSQTDVAIKLHRRISKETGLNPIDFIALIQAKL